MKNTIIIIYSSVILGAKKRFIHSLTQKLFPISIMHPGIPYMGAPTTMVEEGFCHPL